MDLREYDRMAAAEQTMWWYAGMRAITGRILTQHLPASGRLRILDAGCGTGANLAALAQYGAVIGIDLAPLALQHSRVLQRPLAQASMTVLPFADATFDLVTNLDVLVMLPLTQARQAIGELARVTATGGLVLLRSAAHNWLRGRHDVAWATQHRYLSSELAQMGASVGLRVCFHSHANTLLMPLAVLKRMLEPVFPNSGDSDTRLPPRWLNAMLRSMLMLESRLLPRLRLPFGLSAIALFQKPATGPGLKSNP